MTLAETIGVVCVVYALTWGGFFLSAKAVFWDDWLLVTIDRQSLLELFRSSGLPWIGWMHAAIGGIGPTGYLVVSFVAYLVAAFALLGILRRIDQVTPNQRLLVVVVFAAAPLNPARHLMIVLPYAVSLAAFFVAWYLLVRTPRVGWLTAGIAGLLFVAACATTASLLVFFAVPLTHITLRRSAEVGLRRAVYRTAPWLALPTGVWLGKSMAFRTSGFYADYNRITARGLVSGTLVLAWSALPLGVLLRESRSVSVVTRRVWIPFFVGTTLIATALLPYTAVGKTAPYSGWASRNYLLVPLGVAVAVMALLRLVSDLWGPGLAQVLAAGLATGFVLVGAGYSYLYLVDWQKQEAVIDALRGNDAVRTARLVVFDDNTRGYNVWGRDITFYEWSGMLQQAYGNRIRLGVAEGVEFDDYLANRPWWRTYYGSGSFAGRVEGYEPVEDATVVTIRSEGRGLLSGPRIRLETRTDHVGLPGEDSTDEGR